MLLNLNYFTFNQKHPGQDFSDEIRRVARATRENFARLPLSIGTTMCFVCDAIAPRCNWTYGESFEWICYGTSDCPSSAAIDKMNWELYY